jgi:hypothetical protein
MDLSVEHVLMFALVVCALYYLMGCDCKEGFNCETTKSLASKELNSMNCSTEEQDIIALADKWCDKYSKPNYTTPNENMCVQQGCQPEHDGQKLNCVSQKP